MIESIASKLGISPYQVKKTVELLNEDATIPFIARYRKEATGSLDEVVLFEIQKLKKAFDELEKRKASILKNLKEQGVLNEVLEQKIKNAVHLTELEDLYLPYKKKRKTKAGKARNAGLEGLAKIIMSQKNNDLHLRAKSFLSEDYPTTQEALEGARHIIAEWVNENTFVRNDLRRFYEKQAVLVSKAVKKKSGEKEAQKFRDYFDWSEKLKTCPSHRLLAMSRGEKEGFLSLKIKVDNEEAMDRIKRFFIKSHGEPAEQIKLAVEDAYKRLLTPSIENEILKKYKEKAGLDAIKVFSGNLRQLLLSPPLGEKRVLAVDPGFRTGCKIAVLDAQGHYLSHHTIYPHAPHNKTAEAAGILKKLVEKYDIEAFSVGNGTASRETLAFVNSLDFKKNIPVYPVNEDGASIYSASEVAREEFPGLDITLRGAISIGRRLQDPLAELVKIDPKSIGVGQYQHDVNANLLKEELENVVIYVVNAVGVNLNTASKYLLKYVSGIGEKLAGNIVEYRSKNGFFKSREDLKKVKGLGKKAFEQSAGFLRIKNGENPLDDSAVHPESYKIVYKMAQSLGVPVKEMIGNEKLLKNLSPEKFIEPGTGLPSVQDIIEELKKPGLDIREKISEFAFDPALKKMEDLKIGEVYPGIINNITNFGCFVDLGIKENGLIHISNLSPHFVSDPNEIVKLHQKVRVKVIGIDMERKRIALSLI